MSRVATEGLRQSGDRPGARSIKADDNRRLSVWIPTQPDRYDTGDRKQASLILCFYFLDGHYRPLQAKPKRRKDMLDAVDDGAVLAPCKQQSDQTGL